MTTSTVESASGRPPHAPTVVVAGSQVRPAEELFTALRKGSVLQKYGRRGTPKFHHFILSPDDKELQWKSSKNSVRSVNLLLVNQVLQGQRTQVFQRQLNPNVDHLSFSLIYTSKGSERSLDLVCKTSFEYETWYWGIQLVISCLRQGQPIIPPVAPNKSAEGDGTGHHDGYIPPMPMTLERKREIGDCYIWGAPPKSAVEDAEEVAGWQTSSSPVLVHHTNALDIVKVACGPRHAVLITRGHEVYTWGVGSGGCLGHGNLQSQVYPSLAVHLLKKGTTSVCCGETMTAAVTKEGGLYTWGTGTSGQLGHGNLSMYCTPTRVVNLIEHKVVQVACGPYHTCIVADNGMLFSWGDGLCGKLGHGNHDSVLVPKVVEALLDKRVLGVACGWWHTGAVAVPRKTDGPKAALQAAANAGSLYTWGGDFVWSEFETTKKGTRTSKRDNHKGCLGHGDLDGRLYPTPVTGQLDAAFVKQVVCGLNFTVVLSTDGRVFQMGCTSAVNAVEKKASWEGAKVPEPVDGNLQRLYAEEVACGMQHIAVVASIIDAKGTIPRESKRTKLLTWGKNHLGQLGLGTTIDHAAPQVVTSFGSRKILHVACGGNHTLAVCEHDPSDTLSAQAADLEGFQKIMAKKPPPTISIPAQSNHSDSSGRAATTTRATFMKKEQDRDFERLSVGSTQSKSLTHQQRGRFKAGVSSSVDTADPARARSMSLRLSAPNALPSPSSSAATYTPSHSHNHIRHPIPVVRSHSNLPTRAWKESHILNDDASSTTSSGLLTSQDSFQFPNAPPPPAITFSDPMEQAKWGALQERVKKLERQLQQRNSQVEQLRSAAHRRGAAPNLLGLTDDIISDSEVSTNPPPSPLSPSLRSTGGTALTNLFRLGNAVSSQPAINVASSDTVPEPPTPSQTPSQGTPHARAETGYIPSGLSQMTPNSLRDENVRRTTGESTTSTGTDDASRRGTVEPDLSFRLSQSHPMPPHLLRSSSGKAYDYPSPNPDVELQQLRLDNAQLRKEVERLQSDVERLQQQLQEKQDANAQEWPLLLAYRMQKAQQQPTDRPQPQQQQPQLPLTRNESSSSRRNSSDIQPTQPASQKDPSTPSSNLVEPANQLQPADPNPFLRNSLRDSFRNAVPDTQPVSTMPAAPSSPVEPKLPASVQPTPQASPRLPQQPLVPQPGSTAVLQQPAGPQVPLAEADPRSPGGNTRSPLSPTGASAPRPEQPILISMLSSISREDLAGAGVGNGKGPKPGQEEAPAGGLPRPQQPIVEPAALPPMQNHRRSRSADGYSRQPAIKSPRPTSQATPAPGGTIMEEVDPGVYLTLEPLGGGSFELRRIRFSKRHFTHIEAEAWWANNKDRIKDEYNLVTPNNSSEVGSKPELSRHQRSSSVSRTISLDNMHQRDKAPMLPSQPAPEEWAITTTLSNGNGNSSSPAPRPPMSEAETPIKPIASHPDSRRSSRS